MPASPNRNSLNTLEALVVGTEVFTYYSLKAAESTLGDLSHLPCCMRILLENLLRNENGTTVTEEDMRSLTAFHALHKNTPSLNFSPARVLMNEEASVSVLSDLACLQDSLMSTLTPPVPLTLACPTDIVVNETNIPLAQNLDRFTLIKWGEKNLTSMRIIPPGHGTANQVNLNALTSIVQITHEDGNDVPLAIPDTVLGTERYLTSINSLGVLGWNADALEIESVLLGYPTPMNLPSVIGLRLTDELRHGTTATDVALALTKVLLQDNCQNKIVEFYGPGLDHLTIPDRAVIAGLVSECGALCTYFPVDRETINYLTQTGCTPEHCALVETYAKAQGLWRESESAESPPAPLTFTVQFEMSLESIRPALGGPIDISSISTLNEAASAFLQKFPTQSSHIDPLAPIKHGDFVLAALSSHGSTANPMEMVLAGLIARKARAQGLEIKPWVKTVMAQINPVVTTLLRDANLLADLEALGFLLKDKDHTTYLLSESATASLTTTIDKNQITVCTIASGTNRSNTPRHPLAKADYVASPALVIAYALAGTIQTDLSIKPLSTTAGGIPVLLRDLWPTADEINAIFEATNLINIYKDYRQTLFEEDPTWKDIPVGTNANYAWNETSDTVRCPPFLKDFSLQQPKLSNIKGARIVLLCGDDVPAHVLSGSGAITESSPAGRHLAAQGKTITTLNTFARHTGNYEIMIRGAFTDEALINNLMPDDAAIKNMSVHRPSQTVMSVFDVVDRYTRESTPMVLVAGKNFGSGHNHEWAAKSIRILGIKTVVAESFDPTFRLNLVRVGVLPLQLKSGVMLDNLNLTGEEVISFAGIPDMLRPRAEVMMTIEHPSDVERYILVCRIETQEEISIFTNGSLLAAKLRKYLPLAV